MKILVCTDGSEIAKNAIEYAADFTKNYRSDLTVMYVIDHETSMKKPVYDKYGDQTHKAKEVLKEAKKTIAQASAETKVTERIAVGPVSREIVRIAKAEGFGRTAASAPDNPCVHCDIRKRDGKVERNIEGDTSATT